MGGSFICYHLPNEDIDEWPEELWIEGAAHRDAWPLLVATCRSCQAMVASSGAWRESGGAAEALPAMKARRV